MSLGTIIVPMMSMKMTLRPRNSKNERANAAIDAVMTRTTLDTPARISELSMNRGSVVSVHAIS